MRIAPTSTTSTPGQPGQAQGKQAESGFQALLASVSGQGIAGSGTTAPSAKTQSALFAANDSAGEQGKTQAAPGQQEIDQESGDGSSAIANAVTSPTTSVSAGVQTTQPAPIPTLVSLLANIAEQNLSESGATAAGSKTQASSSTASHATGKQEKEQTAAVLSSASSGATVAVAQPVVQAVAPAWSLANGLGNSRRSGEGSSGTSAGTVDNHAAAAIAQRSATSLKQPNGDAAANGTADGQAPTDAASTPAGNEVAIAAPTFTLPVDLPVTAALTDNSNVNQLVSKTASKQTSNTPDSKNSDLTSTTDAGKGNAADAPSLSSASSDASSQGAQSGGPSTQHAPTDPTSAVAAMPKGADAGTPQAPAVLTHAVSHDATTMVRTTSGTSEATRQSDLRSDSPSSQVDGTEAAPASGINSAKLIQNMSETEMHVGLRSTEFGDISIRTLVSQQQMQAQISLDHGDLSQAILAHVSTVQTKLGNEYGLQASISVNHQGAAFSGDSSQSSQREQRAFTKSVRAESISAVAEPDSGSSSSSLVAAVDGSRLDIQA